MTEDRTSSEHVHRRTALRAGAATAAAAAAAVVATSSGAQAAAGQPVVQGGSNVVGTATTYVFSSGATPTLQVRNTGAGAAAAFLSTSSNGFAGGTAAGSKYGLSAANTGAAAGGAAMAASGGNNTGIITNTRNPGRYALEATNLSEDHGDSGAISADGGLGAAVVAYNDTDEVPALVVGGGTVAFRDLILADGALAITYTSSATLFGTLSPSQPAITIAGAASLTASGTATIAIDADVVADADLTGASVSLTPRSGPMPNLWGVVNSNGTVSVSGGAASGTVNYLITLQLAIPAQLLMSADADRRADLLARAREAVRR